MMAMTLMMAIEMAMVARRRATVQVKLPTVGNNLVRNAATVPLSHCFIQGHALLAAVGCIRGQANFKLLWRGGVLLPFPSTDNRRFRLRAAIIRLHSRGERRPEFMTWQWDPIAVKSNWQHLRGRGMHARQALPLPEVRDSGGPLG